MGSPGSLEHADGRRRHAGEVEIDKLPKVEPVRLKIVEAQRSITIGRTTSIYSYQKQGLADACNCQAADKCWAVAMSSKPWPLKLHACNHHTGPEHASHGPPCHLGLRLPALTLLGRCKLWAAEEK